MLNTASTFNPAINPPEVMHSVYGPALPEQRAPQVEGMVSLRVRDLFPDIPPAIYSGGKDVSAVRRAAEAALARVDMSMIKPGDSVNILCSEHGFGIIGGWPYAEMLRTIKDVLEARSGCKPRLVVIAWLGAKEPEEIIKYYDFDAYFEGRTRGAHPFDRGVPIETELGTLYGLNKVYNSKWIIHCHYDDPREIYAHRMIDRVTKPFGMSYARFETRSIFHTTFGARSGNFIGRAIANSSFVREKLAFSCDLMSSPDGIIGVDADNSLEALGERVTCNVLQCYGTMLELFRRIDECIVVLDGGKWPYYVHAGGMIFGQLYFNGKDWFDLDKDATPQVVGLMGQSVNTGIKAVVLNQGLIGLPLLGLPVMYPTIVANQSMVDTMRRDFSNQSFMDYADQAENLVQAIGMAKERGGTDKIIFFDGSYGAINLSPSMAEALIEKARGCTDVVAELLPKWLKQRGIDPRTVSRH